MQKIKKNKIEAKNTNKNIRTIAEEPSKKKKQQMENLKKSTKKGIIETPVIKSKKGKKVQKPESESEDEIIEEVPGGQSDSEQDDMEVDDEYNSGEGSETEQEVDAEEDDEEVSDGEGEDEEVSDDDGEDEEVSDEEGEGEEDSECGEEESGVEGEDEDEAESECGEEESEDEDDEEKEEDEEESKKLKKSKKLKNENSEKKIAKDIVQKRKTPIVNTLLGSAVLVQKCPPGTTCAELAKLFSSCGEVISIIFSYRYRLFFMPKIDNEGTTVFIVFNSKEAADKALDLGDTEVNGRKIFIKKYDTLGKNKISGPRPNIFAKRPYNNDNTVFVSNLNPKTNHKDLSNFFSKSCKTLKIALNKNQPGKAYVTLEKPEAVKLALELNGSELDGQKVNIAKYRTRNNFNPKGRVPHHKGGPFRPRPHFSKN